MYDIKNLPKDFKWRIYLKLNKDLYQTLDKKEAIKHYLKHGIKENRIYKIDYSKIPDDFDWKKYIEINNDLNYIKTEVEALAHFLSFGINEKRKYRNDYNEKRNEIVDNYLKKRNNITIENKNYSISGDFDFLFYYFFNKDICAKVNCNMIDIYNHYIKYGINEKRIIKNESYFNKIIELLVINYNSLFNSESCISDIINLLYENNINVYNFN